MANVHGYAQAALDLYKDKYIEINTGEVSTTLLFADSQIGQKSIIRGVLIDAIGDGMIVECEMKHGTKRVLINCWSIKSIVEIDGTGLTKDVYVDQEGRKR